MSGFVGSCLSMCPQNERTMRIDANRVHKFEKGKKRDLVKEFIRAGAGNKVDPAELRPAKVLHETTIYLINEIVPCEDQPFHEVYNFVFDRFRAIRQDMTIQKIEGDAAIKIYEIISRFLLYSNYRLCNEVEQFCPVTNMKHIVECLNKLSSLRKTGNSTHEAEFLSYHLLVCFGNPGVIMHALAHSHLREDEMVKVALLMNMAWIRGNYFKVLKLTTQLTPLQACIFHQKLNLVRMSLVRVLAAAYAAKNVSFPLTTLSGILIYEDVEAQDCLSLLESCGANVSDGDKVIFSRQKLVLEDKLQAPSLWVGSLLEHKKLQHLLMGSSEDEVTDLVEKLKITS